MPFPGRKEPFGFGTRLLLPLSCEALLRDCTSLTSVSFLGMRKLESESEVTSWRSMGHIGLAEIFCPTVHLGETLVWCLLKHSLQACSWPLALSCNTPGSLLWKPGSPRQSGHAVLRAGFKGVEVWLGLFFHVLPLHSPPHVPFSRGVDCPPSPFPLIGRCLSCLSSSLLSLWAFGSCPCQDLLRDPQVSDFPRCQWFTDFSLHHDHQEPDGRAPYPEFLM